MSRPKPDWVMLCGAIAATAGYLLPWFVSDDDWVWQSGGDFASVPDGGGNWTMGPLFWFAAVILTALWAGRSAAAAIIGVTATVAGGFFTLAVVAANFAVAFSRASSPDAALSYVTDPSLDVGFPLLAAGLGLALAGGIRSIARGTPRPTPDR